MKLHSWNFQKLCSTPLKFQGLYLRLAENSTWFLFWSPLQIPFLGPWTFHILFFQFPKNSMSSTRPLPLPGPLYIFLSEIAHSCSYTDNFLSHIFPVSYEWYYSVVEIKYSIKKRNEKDKNANIWWKTNKKKMPRKYMYVSIK